jgi:hypothetical protein
VRSPSLLSRGALPPEAARRVASHLLDMSVAPQDVLDLLAQASRRDGPGQAQISENAGLIAVMFLACLGQNDESLNVRDVVIGDAPLGHLRLNHVNFERVVFRRTDMSAAVWLNCRASACTFTEVLVSCAMTRLDIAASEPEPSFVGLRVLVGESTELVYEAMRLRETLATIGVLTAEEDISPSSGSSVTEEAREVITVVEAVVEAFRRGSLIPEDEAKLRSAASSRCWVTVRDALLEAELLTVETRSLSGPRRDFYRRHFLPQDLMNGLTERSDRENINTFWRRLGIAPTS